MKCLQIDHLHVLLQSRSIKASGYISKLAWLNPPSASLSSFNPIWKVYNQGCLITASNWNCECIWFRPPRAYTHTTDYRVQLHLWVHSTSTMKYIGNLAWSRSLIASPSSLDLCLPVYLQSHSIMACNYISKVTQSRNGEMAELSWHPKGMYEKERFCIM
jgi:hypothetical protein